MLTRSACVHKCNRSSHKKRARRRGAAVVATPSSSTAWSWGGIGLLILLNRIDTAGCLGTSSAPAPPTGARARSPAPGGGGGPTTVPLRVPLSSGVSAEVLTSAAADGSRLPRTWSSRFGIPSPRGGRNVEGAFKPSGGGGGNEKPPLLFLHGSFHASWCWAEEFFPYFVERGYDVAALSLRGTGGTFAGDGVKKVKIEEHVDDLSAFLEWTRGRGNGNGKVTDESADVAGRYQPDNTAARPPVVIAHSFGGLAVMKYLERLMDEGDPEQAARTLSGLALLCSVPPSGNGRMTMRYLRRSLRDSWKITAGLAMKKCITDKRLCRELFFGGDEDGGEGGAGVSDSDLGRYQGYFARDTVATIDLANLARQLPSALADDDGRAPFVSQLPPCLVVGATDDFIVDKEGVIETASYFGVEAQFVDSPHDVMLGSKWKNCADAILRWLEELVL